MNLILQTQLSRGSSRSLARTNTGTKNLKSNFSKIWRQKEKYSLKMVTNIKASGALVQISAKATASTFGRMVRRMRGTSLTTLIKVMGALSMLTGHIMKASGSTIWRMDMAFMCMRMAHATKACGHVTNRMAKALKHGLMAPATKVSTASERNSEMAPSNGMTTHNLMATSLIIISRATVFTFGVTIVDTRENGLTI